jgi:hypothetical protein
VARTKCRLPQDQTDAAITNAEHSPGFGDVNPTATAALNAFGVDDGTRASADQDFQTQLAQTDNAQFTVPADSATARKKAEVAAAVTAVHAEVTGAPGDNSCP